MISPFSPEGFSPLPQKVTTPHLVAIAGLLSHIRGTNHRTATLPSVGHMTSLAVGCNQLQLIRHLLIRFISKYGVMCGLGCDTLQSGCLGCDTLQSGCLGCWHYWQGEGLPRVPSCGVLPRDTVLRDRTCICLCDPDHPWFGWSNHGGWRKENTLKT
jgi:hypothetical protein